MSESKVTIGTQIGYGARLEFGRLPWSVYEVGTPRLVNVIDFGEAYSRCHVRLGVGMQSRGPSSPEEVIRLAGVPRIGQFRHVWANLGSKLRRMIARKIEVTSLPGGGRFWEVNVEYVDEVIFRCEQATAGQDVVIDPRWLTSTVIDLTASLRGDHAFDRLPILADALMDAGCDDEGIIAHLRDPLAATPHPCRVLMAIVVGGGYRQ